MKKTLTSIAITVLAITNYSLAQTNKNNLVINNSNFKSPVVLELFTSQGCSSCPPADFILSKYATENNGNVIPLAFHVDYWNRLGWKDPFSKAQYSERQREYAQKINSSSVYTPQLIINGKYELVGSKENEIAEIVAKESKINKLIKINIESNVLKDNIVKVKFNLSEIDSNSLVNTALVKKKEITSIKKGENSGLKQTNNNIVFDFKTMFSNNKNSFEQTFKFDKNWKSSDFLIVIYIQNKKTGNVICAIQSEIN